MVRVTRNEAAARLGISKSTLDRVIKRGELTTETEQHGRRHTVWVLMDDVSENPSGVTSEDSGKHIGGDTGAKNLALQSEELLGQLKTLTAALPAGEPTAPKAKRWWWPFR